MQKHRERPKGRRAAAINANVRLSESAVHAVEELLSELGDGEDEFSVAYLRSEYLSKYCRPDRAEADLRRQRAVEKWLATEEDNERTNARLTGRDPGYNIMPRVTWSSFLRFARRIISDVLGPLTDEVVVGSFSGGASTSRKRTESHPAQKFVGEADVTREAYQYVDVIHRVLPALRQYGSFYLLREVDGAVLFTVPKKTDIDRCACKEPDINMFLQKGVGAHIRRRLRRFGINLNDQAVNRRLAREGSISGALATLDLSSASDTITIECIRALLPSDWFLYLDDIRSREVVVDGKPRRTAMFSSMGNGFTFELESLVFYALMRAVSYFEGITGVISVYGDDIIIPSGMYDMACWTLHEFGFRVNPDKSFAAGPFRESCGGHYHLGEDVTPFYLKRPPTHLTDLIRVANQLRRWAMADPLRRYALPSTYKMWIKLASMVPPVLWGGRDYAVDSQLVSPGAPNKRLVRASGTRELPEVGRYLAWHNSNWNRTVEPEVAFEPVETEKTFCRLRRANSGASTYTELFWEEQFGSADS